MKQCPRCEELLPLSAFYPAKGRALGVSAYCRECTKAKSAAWAAANPDKVKANQAAWVARNAGRVRDTKLKSHYQMIPGQYAEMFEKQGGLCLVCLAPGKLVVDHCHDTGRIRGLLHTNCNVALGMLGDDERLVAVLAAFFRDNPKE